MAGKSRSKNYPAFGLGEAIKKARQLYDTDGKAAIAADSAVHAWGYGGLNGASLGVLGALRQYGLLEAPGTKMVKLTDLALRILVEPEDSPIRQAAIVEAGSKPPMFQEIRQQYPEGLPSDASIKAWLIRSQGFNESAAERLIVAFRDTDTLVQQADNRDIPASERKVPARQPLGGGGATPDAGRRMVGIKTFTADLPGNAVATVTIEGGPLAGGALKLLKSFLALVEGSLEQQAQDVGIEKQPAPEKPTGAGQ